MRMYAERSERTEFASVLMHKSFIGSDWVIPNDHEKV